MKICHLLNTAGTGGAEVFTLELVRRTDVENVEYTVCYLGKSHNLVPKFEEAGARVLCFDSHTDTPQLDPSVVPKFFNSVRKEEYDILHAHMPYMQFLARLTAYFVGGIKVVSTQHTPREALPTISKALVSLTQSLDSATVSVSNGVRQSFAENDTLCHVREGNGRLCTIHNGIDVGSFNQKVKAATPPDGFDTDGPVFLSIGRYVSQKGHRYLIEAMGHLADEIPDARAVIVGFGPLEEDLKARVQSLGLEGTVTIAGKSSEVERYYALADVFVISSVVEGLPVVGLEAMAGELPVVGTFVPGVEDLVVDGETGFLVSPRSPERLAEAMSSFGSDADPRRMGRRGFERVRRHFDIENTVDEYLELYLTVLGANEF